MQTPALPQTFGRIVRLACALLDAPAALLFEFGDDGRVLLASHGVDAEWKEGEGEDGLHPVATVPIAGKDGVPAGSLVVLDRAGRAERADQRAPMEELAALAAGELEWRRKEADSRSAHAANGELLRREREARAAAEQAERRAAFLAEVGMVLDDALDYEAAFEKLVRLAIPRLADYCLIDEMEADGGTRRIARAHVDPEKQKVLWDRVRHPPEADPDHHPIMQAIGRGQSVLVGECTDEVIDVIAHDAAHRVILTQVLRLHSFMIVPLVARGRVLGLITLAFSDSGRRYGSTELALAEEMARRAALAIDNARLYGQAQQAVRAREGVLAVVSHDLRNALASILLNTSTVLELAAPGVLDPWVADSLRQTTALVEQSNRLIEDLLDVSRVANGGITLLRAPHDLRDLAARAERMLRPLAEDRGLGLTVSLPAVPVPVNADGDRVLQVLSNLVGNALKFTPAGGRVDVEVEAQNGVARVTVRDTGIGIAAAELEHVFDPFRQLGDADRRGVGLGLPIARGIVEAHGGRIWLESAPGEGTTFTFTLPLHPPPPEDEE
ncbi:MAG TPA: GAF domain-containing sensor histidine kinase [Longimicrobium sp.]|nr:GAF domain-containing sensor histidine kinase [Longimicrobium sp.]